MTRLEKTIQWGYKMRENRMIGGRAKSVNVRTFRAAYQDEMRSRYPVAAVLERGDFCDEALTEAVYRSAAVGDRPGVVVGVELLLGVET